MNRTWRTGRHRDLGDDGLALLLRDVRRALRERGDGMLWAAALVGIGGVGALVGVEAGRLPAPAAPAAVSVSASVGPVDGEPVAVAAVPVAPTTPAVQPTSHLAPALAISGQKPPVTVTSSRAAAAVTATSTPTAVAVYPTAVTFVPVQGSPGGYGGGSWGYGGGGGGHR